MQLPTSERKRGTYVGGPDAAAIIGTNRFATAGDVYARIVHGWKPEANKRMKRGLLLEAGLLEHASRWRGKEVVRDVFYRHDKVGHLCCSVDGVEPAITRPGVIHETKTTRSESAGPDFDDRWGPTDSAAVDPGAADQCQYEMGITGARECHLWLYDGDVDDDPRHYELSRNNNRISELFEACDAFWWDHVDLQKPPPRAPYDSEAAAKIWPEATPDKIVDEVTNAMVTAAIEYASARVIRDTAKEVMDRAAAFLADAMGKAEIARWGGTKKDSRPKGSVFFKATRLTEPVTNWEAVAYEIARRFNVPGPYFFGLVAENTRRPFTLRHIRVFVSGIKRKATHVPPSNS